MAGVALVMELGLARERSFVGAFFVIARLWNVMYPLTSDSCSQELMYYLKMPLNTVAVLTEFSFVGQAIPIKPTLWLAPALLEVSTRWDARLLQPCPGGGHPARTDRHFGPAC